MADLIIDGFDHYGGSRARMLEGAWAEIDNTAGLSTDQARTGSHSFKFDVTDKARRVIPVAGLTMLCSLGFFAEGLPGTSSDFAPIQFATGANVDLISVTIEPDGSLVVHDGGRVGTSLGQTAANIIMSGTWHHIECKFFNDAAVGTFELRVDEVVVMSLSGLALSASAIGIYKLEVGSGTGEFFYIDDLIVRDDQGTFNNDFQGDLRVATLQPIANGVNQGWTQRTKQKLGAGIAGLQRTTRDAGLAFDDDPAFELGSGDYALEMAIRFDQSLVASEFSQLLGKWQTFGDQRSWRIRLNGPDVGANLVFETSVLGTTGDIVVVQSFPFIPNLFQWYHLAITREGTTSRMFLDGKQVGIDQVDSRTYFDGTAQLMFNAEQDTALNTTIPNTGMSGWCDGGRITVGAARYTANFTPPTASLPTDVTGDPLFASVAILLDFNTVVVGFDGSANGFLGTSIKGMLSEFPDDAIAFQTVDGLSPDDENFVEASLLPATETLSLTANPLDTETVTLGATTYTFLTVLVDTANNVLIGVDRDDSLVNLRKAVNLEAGVGVEYGTGTLVNASASLSVLGNGQALATALTPGAAGNAIVSTETLTSGSWGGVTLSGGQDIPANSEFTLSNLPPSVTGVRSVAIITRNFKTDSGSATFVASLVEEGGALIAGAARALTVNPVYSHDIIEQDPSSSGAITPNTLLNARVRLDRTA